MILSLLKEAYDLKVLEKPQRAKKSSGWRSSSLGSCLRGQFLARLLSGDFEVQYDQRTLEVFELGDIIEDKYVQDLKFLENKYVVITQGEMYDASLNNSGHFDVLLINRDTLVAFLTDFKSKNSRAFTYMDKKGQGAMHHHELQVYSYLDMINRYGFALSDKENDNAEIMNFFIQNMIIVGQVPRADGTGLKHLWKFRTNAIRNGSPVANKENLIEGSVTYISKDDQRKLEYPVMYPNKSLEQEYYNERMMLNTAWENQDVLPPNEAGTWQSKYCKYCEAGLCQKLSEKGVVEDLFKVVAEQEAQPNQ